MVRSTCARCLRPAGERHIRARVASAQLLDRVDHFPDIQFAEPSQMLPLTSVMAQQQHAQ